MRKAFIDNLILLAEKDKRIFLLAGDLGYGVLEEFRDKFPDRFFNAGVAEQNMIGMAAGLALSGKIVFAYSIVPFIVMRCLEQIRNDLCFHNLSVRLIGVGGGLSYGYAGMTHNTLADIAVMRSLVNMTVVCPGDRWEAKETAKLSANHLGPLYIRLGRSKEEKLYSGANFRIGKGFLIKQGKDLTIIATGSILSLGKQVSEQLEKQDFSVRLISMPTIKPLDDKIVLESIRKTKAIFTLEEHSVVGGLGSAVSEILAEQDKKILFKRIGLPDNYIKEIGYSDYLLEKKGLSVGRIVKNISASFQKRRKNENAGRI